MTRIVALFDPVLPHYRTALVRKLREQSTYCYHFFSADRDVDGDVMPMKKDDDAVFFSSEVIRLPAGLRWQTNTLRACFGKKYSVVILPGNAKWISSWAGMIVARLVGKPALLWTHGWTRKDRGFVRVLRMIFYRLSNGLLLYGDRAREIGLSLGFRLNFLHVMYNSLDIDAQMTSVDAISQEQRARIRKQLFESANIPVVIASGRLTAAKRFDMAIRAVMQLNESGYKVNLLIVGSGPEEPKLRELAASAGASVRFVGACYDESALAGYFACAVVSVYPGNIGLACMQSLAYGVPTITHDDPSEQNPEWEAIQPGVNGELFSRGSVTDLARALRLTTGASWLSEAVAQKCRESIKSKYRPVAQVIAIDNAVQEAIADQR